MLMLNISMFIIKIIILFVNIDGGLSLKQTFKLLPLSVPTKIVKE